MAGIDLEKVTMPVVAPRYELGEEIASSVLHGIGAALAIVGVAVLATAAALHGDAWHVVGCSVFGGALVFLYSASTLYHSIQNARAKALLRKLDHAAIPVLIAGTYTPFTLVTLRGPWGWSLFGVVWGLALVGFVLQATFLRESVAASLALYLSMGWVVVAAVGPLLSAVAPGGLVLLVSGGIAYTVGCGFYAWQRLPYNHAVWHGFVLAGSTFHFFAVLYYVIPLSGLPGG